MFKNNFINNKRKYRRAEKARNDIRKTLEHFDEYICDLEDEKNNK